MAKRARQLQLDLGNRHLWDQLKEETQQQCLALLKQLIQEVWRQPATLGEGSDHD
jgi:hypothetical protein